MLGGHEQQKNSSALKLLSKNIYVGKWYPMWGAVDIHMERILKQETNLRCCLELTAVSQWTGGAYTVTQWDQF